MFGYNPLRLRLDPSSKGTFTSIVTPQTADLMGNIPTATGNELDSK